MAASPQGRDLLQGRVTQVFRFGDRLFVGLDTTRSGQMDTRVKIKARAVVGGSRGNRLAFEAIRPGGTLTLVAYTLDQDGYYEAFHVIVGKRALPAPAQAGQPLQGKVLETIPFGDDLFIRLDANGDGQADYSR